MGSGRWQRAPPAPCQSTKGTSDVFLFYLLQGEVPHSHRGLPGARGREAKALLKEATLPNTFQKYLQEPFVFHTPSLSDEVGLIPVEFAKLCLAEPSSLHLLSLMGTVWMESQHSPRFWGGAEVTMCATFVVTAFPSFSGKALKGHGVEEKAAGKAQHSPERCQGLVFPPQDAPRLQTHAGCQMEPRGNIFWCCLYAKAHGSFISWASSMPRAQAWLLPHPSQTIPFEVRTAGKCQNAARCPSLCISSWLDQLRAELRAVVTIW